jgi:hypothetical protein
MILPVIPVRLRESTARDPGGLTTSCCPEQDSKLKEQCRLKVTIFEKPREMLRENYVFVTESDYRGVFGPGEALHLHVFWMEVSLLFSGKLGWRSVGSGIGTQEEHRSQGWAEEKRAIRTHGVQALFCPFFNLNFLEILSFLPSLTPFSCGMGPLLFNPFSTPFPSRSPSCLPPPAPEYITSLPQHLVVLLFGGPVEIRWKLKSFLVRKKCKFPSTPTKSSFSSGRLLTLG